MVVIAGVDLSWSGRKPTGMCVIRINGIPEVARCDGVWCEDAAGAGRIAGLLNGLGPEVVAGVDAPLIAGPRRSAESRLARAYGKQGVYAYSARPDFLSRHRIEEGPRLGRLLAGSGWNLDPARLEPGGTHALEVFPHATAVSLLGAARVLRYKRGPIDARLGPLSELQGRLRAYAAAELNCLFDGDTAEVLELPVARMSGRELKSLEDRLDAVVCAVAAYHAWRHGPAGLEVFGDAGEGYIAVPVRVTSSRERTSP